MRSLCLEIISREIPNMDLKTVQWMQEKLKAWEKHLKSMECLLKLAPKGDMVIMKVLTTRTSKVEKKSACILMTFDDVTCVSFRTCDKGLSVEVTPSVASDFELDYFCAWFTLRRVPAIKPYTSRYAMKCFTSNYYSTPLTIIQNLICFNDTTMVKWDEIEYQE